MNSALRDSLYQHQDILKDLNDQHPLAYKLTIVHGVIKGLCPFVDRLAVAVYDEKTDELKTYVHSTPDQESPLTNYTAKLSNAPSLQEIVKLRKPRVVNDLGIFSGGRHAHTSKMNQSEFASSYTMPIYNKLYSFSVL